jgi:hypothetical protein
MQKLIVIILLFTSFLSSGAKKTFYDYYYSYLKTISRMEVRIEDSSLGFTPADYWYSVNNSSFLNISEVRTRDGYPVLVFRGLKLKSDSNLIRIVYRKGGSLIQFLDTMYLVKPVLTIESVKQNNSPVYETNGYYLISSNQPADMKFATKFNENRYIPANPDPNKNYKIYNNGNNEANIVTRVDYKLGDNNWQTASQSSGTVQFANFKEGNNQLLFRYKTSETDDYPQDTISFFYTGIILRPPFSSSGDIWKTDNVVSLYGFPAGGWFTGTGVEPNSTLFNPSKGLDGNNVITYNFPYRGKILTTSTTVKVLAYSFSVEGLQSVCANSSDVKYTITNCNAEFDYTWEITGGKLTSSSTCVGIINWNNNPGLGIIKVTASHKTSTYKVYSYLNVYKTINQAYDVPAIFFGDKDNRLVISSFTSAYEYRWIPDGLNPVVTKSHFYYFNTSIKTSVKLELVTEKGCLSSATLVLSGKPSAYTVSDNNEMESVIRNSPGSMLFPNPAVNYINITVPAEIGELRSVKIYDVKSNLVLVKDWNLGGNPGVLRLDLVEIGRGIYFAQVIGSTANFTEKFILTK